MTGNFLLQHVQHCCDIEANLSCLVLYLYNHIWSQYNTNKQTIWWRAVSLGTDYIVDVFHSLFHQFSSYDTQNINKMSLPCGFNLLLGIRGGYLVLSYLSGSEKPEIDMAWYHNLALGQLEAGKVSQLAVNGLLVLDYEGLSCQHVR